MSAPTMMKALSSAKFTVAVVEEDEAFRLAVCGHLRKSGIDAWGVESAEDFYISLLLQKADLVVVDLELPGEDGKSLLRRIAMQGVPVVVLTARNDLESRIDALTAGALQCFVKPPNLNELIAGICSQLRHVRFVLDFRRASRGPEVHSWSLDKNAVLLVAPNQGTVPLTSRELELVSLLMSANGGCVSKHELLETMGYIHLNNGFHRIESQLTRLRRKTLQATGMALPIRAIFGKGLIFAA